MRGSPCASSSGTRSSCFPSCLESVRGAVDEIVLVDTGSSDRTVEVTFSAGATVLPRNEDFAAPRTVAFGRPRVAALRSQVRTRGTGTSGTLTIGGDRVPKGMGWVFSRSSRVPLVVRPTASKRWRREQGEGQLDGR